MKYNVPIALSTGILLVVLATGCSNITGTSNVTENSTETLETSSTGYIELEAYKKEETTEENMTIIETHTADSYEATNTVTIDGRTYSYSYATTGPSSGENDTTKWDSYTEEILLTPLEGDTNISIDNEGIRFVFSDDADISSASKNGYVFEATVNNNHLTFTAYVYYNKDEDNEEIREGLKSFLRYNLEGFGFDSGIGEESIIFSKYLCDIT